MNQDHLTLLARTRSLLLLSQRELGALSGASRRTVRRLAMAVHPRDPALSADLAKAGQTTLAALGLAPPAGSQGHSLGSADLKHVVDSVVCAAVDASGVASVPTRAGLLAAVVRAKALGLSLDALQAGLGAVPAAAKR